MLKKVPFIFLTVFFLWLLNELFFFKPTLFFVSLGLSTLIIILAVKKLVDKKSNTFWLLLTISPILFYFSASFYSSILTNQLWIQFIFFINAFLIFSYLKNIYYYYSFGAPERGAKLNRLLLSASFLAMFAAAATLYALPIFINLSFWSIVIFFIIINIIFFYQSLIFAKDNSVREDWLFLVINTLVLSEFAGVLLLLPLNYNVRGFLLAIFFYSLILFNNWRQEGRLNFRNLRWPLISVFLIMLIILFSARWR